MGKVNYLFPNFLTDLNELRESQLFWIRLCLDVLETQNQQNQWVIGSDPPQHDLSDFTSYGIAGGFNFEKTKGIAINQLDPTEYDWEMTAYTSESDRFSDTTPLVYVEFNCKLSVESAKTFSQLFEKWIQPECDRAEIEKHIKMLNLSA